MSKWFAFTHFWHVLCISNVSFQLLYGVSSFSWHACWFICTGHLLRPVYLSTTLHWMRIRFDSMCIQAFIWNAHSGPKCIRGSTGLMRIPVAVYCIVLNYYTGTPLSPVDYFQGIRSPEIMYKYTHIHTQYHIQSGDQFVISQLGSDWW